MVRPEDGVADDIESSSSVKVALFTGMQFGENVWTNTGPEQDLSTSNVISAVINKEMAGIQKLANIQSLKKPRFLCLHGHGSSSARFKVQFEKWPEYVTDKIDLVFINGPFPVGDGFEWFTKDTVNKEYDNDFEEGISYIEDRMIELGPFDGVLGFSEGATVAGSLPGIQQQGVCLRKVKKLEYAVIISGSILGGELFPLPKLAEGAYSSPINIPSLHIYGETDIARLYAPELVEAYLDPLVIHHHGGHEVPKLDEKGLKIMFEFLKKIDAII